LHRGSRPCLSCLAPVFSFQVRSFHSVCSLRVSCRSCPSFLYSFFGLRARSVVIFCLAGTPAQIHTWIRFGAAVSRRDLSPCSLVISLKHFPLPICFDLRAKFPVRSQIHSWSAPAACFSLLVYFALDLSPFLDFFPSSNVLL
jgi:hypothetical protein